MAEEFTNQQSKPTYEQLLDYVNQLTKQLNDQRLGEVIAQLNFLFKVVELKDSFPAEYVDQCVGEIQNVITIKKNTENTADETDEPVEVAMPERGKKASARKRK